ncbi:MAG: hypothetical protein IKX75_07690, partial [Desulfovibrio sp.]|nr:hypothetical protein [Desulfovibrio sp.]
MPAHPAVPEAESRGVQPSAIRQALACVEGLDKENRLFVLLDALVCADSSSSANVLMTDLLAQLGVRSREFAFYDWVDFQRRALAGLGAGYLGTEYWCNMPPALRFELCLLAVEEPHIARLLQGLGPRHAQVRDREDWLALAQTAAMYANDETLFGQFYRIRPALLQRRVHLRLAWPSREWFEERKGLVKKVAADDAVKSFLFAGAASPMLGWISRSLAEGTDPAVQAFHPVSKAAVHLWSGRWQAAEAELAGLDGAEEYWQTHCLRGLDRLLHGDAGCLAHFRRAEEIYVRDNPGLLSSLPSLPRFAKKLAAFLFGGEEELEALRRSLENAESRAPSRAAELWDGRNGLQAMRALDCLRQGQEA